MAFLPNAIFPSVISHITDSSERIPEEKNIQVEVVTVSPLAADLNALMLTASGGSQPKLGHSVTSAAGAESLLAPESEAAPPVSAASLPGLGCGEPLDLGPCRQYVVRWYYDPDANACAQFWFGGCHGNSNNFETEAHCRKSCVYT